MTTKGLSYSGNFQISLLVFKYFQIQNTLFIMKHVVGTLEYFLSTTLKRLLSSANYMDIWGQKRPK